MGNEGGCGRRGADGDIVDDIIGDIVDEVIGGIAGFMGEFTGIEGFIGEFMGIEEPIEVVIGGIGDDPIEEFIIGGIVGFIGGGGSGVVGRAGMGPVEGLMCGIGPLGPCCPLRPIGGGPCWVRGPLGSLW